ncbi:MAG: family 10 glycosylhydrolase, partial [Gemmatimonadaceae bacterium]
TKLYADSRTWLQSGWVDYLSPQLYWPIARKAQSYPVLLDWWVAQNTQGRHIWPGMNVYLAKDTAPKGRGAQEILDQIQLTRAQGGATGNVLWSIKTFQQNPDSLDERLARGLYADPALVPASPWLSNATPPRPAVIARRDAISGDLMLDMAPTDSSMSPWLWVVQTRSDSAWSTRVIPGTERTHLLSGRGMPSPVDVRVSAVSRTGNLSPASRLDHPR